MQGSPLNAVALILLSICVAGSTQAQDCLPPVRPFVPGDPDDLQEYADLIKADFENYLDEVQQHFRCLDSERARAFAEAQEVSKEYGKFIETVKR